jgi:hypothetical protein
VAFDLMTRTLTVKHIVVESGLPLTGVKVASVRAAGVRQGDKTRVSAAATCRSTRRRVPQSSM